MRRLIRLSNFSLVSAGWRATGLAALATLALARAGDSLAGPVHEAVQAHAHAQWAEWTLGVGVAAVALLALVLLWNVQLRRSVGEHTQQLEEETNRRSGVQRQLKASQEMVQLIFGAAAAGIVMDTSEGHFLMANPAYLATIGYTEAELRIMDMRELTHPDDRVRYAGLRARMIAGEFSTFSDEKRYLQKGGGIVWVRVTVSLVQSADGQPACVMAMVDDITGRRQAQEDILRLNAELESRVSRRTARLEAVNKELETFAYSVSHDLRSPLNTINGFSQLLERVAGEQLGQQGRHYLNRIQAGTRQMGELIEGLLSLTNVTRDSLHPGTVDLSAIARQMIQELQDAEPGREANVLIEEGLLAQGDPRLLAVVLRHLLGNAWKFTAKQAIARIDFGWDMDVNGETVYYIRDNGAGFDMAYADKLFVAFQRLHSPSEILGSGIGLATVQRIIARHGGKIWAQAAVGLGAVFYFTLGIANISAAPDTL